jgi:hypothetical protein
MTEFTGHKRVLCFLHTFFHSDKHLVASSQDDIHVYIHV